MQTNTSVFEPGKAAGNEPFTCWNFSWNLNSNSQKNSAKTLRLDAKIELPTDNRRLKTLQIRQMVPTVDHVEGVQE